MVELFIMYVGGRLGTCATVAANIKGNMFNLLKISERSDDDGELKA